MVYFPNPVISKLWSAVWAWNITRDMKNIVPVSIYLTLRKLSKSEQNSHISGNFESIKNGPHLGVFKTRCDLWLSIQEL